MDGSDPRTDASNSRTDGSNCRMDGSNWRMDASNSSTDASNSSMSGPNPSMSSSNSRTDGSDRRLHGSSGCKGGSCCHSDGFDRVPHGSHRGSYSSNRCPRGADAHVSKAPGWMGKYLRWRSARSPLSGSEGSCRLVFGIGTADPATFGGVALLLMATALVASMVPALRAVQLDPASVLRSE
jgi:hypothetical protein